MIDKQKLTKRLIANKRVQEAIDFWKLNAQQIEEALPIFIDMEQEKDDKQTNYLTTIKVVNGNVQRAKERSTFFKNFAYQDYVITKHYEPLNFEDDKEFIREEGRKQVMIELAKIFEIWPQKFTRGLYLYGDIGIGKTFILKRIAKKAALKKQKIGFITTANLMQKFKNSFSDSDLTGDLIELLKTVDCLFLDDIGAEVINSWFRDEILFNILNARMEQKKLTFFSSNYSLEKLIEIESRTNKQTFREWDKAKRIVSRIQALAIPIAVKGQNKRY